MNQPQVFITLAPDGVLVLNVPSSGATMIKLYPETPTALVAEARIALERQARAIARHADHDAAEPGCGYCRVEGRFAATHGTAPRRTETVQVKAMKRFNEKGRLDLATLSLEME